ncbi:lysophospholipid acyltransferase family protein [Aureibacillus halotolerans]|uniref:1-acyl-sn-glycerol-3-phosphate acyltransferase n=1 Tax=Aureibacillus halotolerans TaxID=1508390 RepID=A0A4R6U706_9BACI|nr:lysophospholipid acyltransferase family protein [Aureibacillus halotolerans]TDQ41546.1 1-acyl-sn-glycerol-3-phosphate acyltransferase [Aureibacillus halotolerans]
MNLYPLGKALSTGFAKTTFRLEVHGKEHVPKTGGVLLCCNHKSNLDPVILGVGCPREVRYMAKEELFKAPAGKWLMESLKVIPVKRGQSDKLALRKGLAVLQEGEVYGMFPEGTRSKTGELGEGLGGAGFFALRSNAAIVPSAVIGDYRMFGKLKLAFGPPISFESAREEKLSSKEATELIMSKISALIEQYKE